MFQKKYLRVINNQSKALRVKIHRNKRSLTAFPRKLNLKINKQLRIYRKVNKQNKQFPKFNYQKAL